MTERDRYPRVTRVLRVVMLVIVALVALTNAFGWVDADLWIPFVCIIAVMGIGTRGGPVDTLSFVLIEAAVVLLLGVATFSTSRDAIWVASVAVSVLAIGKISLVELHRRDAEQAPVAPRRDASDSTKRLAPVEVPPAEPRAPRDDAPRPVSEPPPAPMSPAPVPRVAPAALGTAAPSEPSTPADAADAADPADLTAEVSAGGTRKRRTRDDPTPKAVRLPR